MALAENPTTVPVEDLAQFTRQMGAMLGAGVSVLRALPVASQHTGNGDLVQIAKDVGRFMEDGREMHEALARHPAVFDAFYLEMARQGEEDGTLGPALLAVADYLDRAADLVSAVGEQPAATSRRAPTGSPAWVAAVVMGSLGSLALGQGILFLAVTDDPGRLLPLSCLWASVCLIGGAWVLSKRTPWNAAATQGERPHPPRKTPERRAEETEALVRSTLEEQEEEEAGRLGADPLMSDELSHRPER